MNPTQEHVFQLATSLEGAWVLRVLGLVVCLAVMGWLLYGGARRRLSRVLVCFGLPLAGFGLALVAAPTEVVTAVASVPYLHRVRFLFGIVSLLVFTVTLGSLRRAYLRERYALLWLLSSLVILLMSLFPDVLALVRALTGLPYENAMAALVSIALLLVCFHFSVALSRLSQDLKAVTQRLAQVELEVQRGQMDPEESLELSKPDSSQDEDMFS